MMSILIGFEKSERNLRKGNTKKLNKRVIKKFLKTFYCNKKWDVC